MASMRAQEHEEEDSSEELSYVTSTTAPSTTDGQAAVPRFGQEDAIGLEEYGEATWSEVCSCNCTHPLQTCLKVTLGLVIISFFLYWFLFAIELLSTGARVLTGCFSASLYDDSLFFANPFSSISVGILTTALLQSSSTTTCIIVSLVAGGVLSVDQAILMVMGTNIGTSLTNTLVALGHSSDKAQLERAFAGATVHDLFNFLSVAVLLPLELLTNYLAIVSGLIVANIPLYQQQPSGSSNNATSTSLMGPLDSLTKPLLNRILIPNQNLLTTVASGNETCDSFYPLHCENDVVSYATCTAGLIRCDAHTNECPIFYEPTATPTDDQVSGGVVFVLGCLCLFASLFGLIIVLQRLLGGVSMRIIYFCTDINGYLAIAIGALLTALVQSSSITTSTLTPLVGIGLLRLEQMYPLTLGANLGTTVTALLASVLLGSRTGLQVAVSHFLFNLSGIVVWYPIPFLRRVPISAARYLGRIAKLWRSFPVLYIVTVFFAVPLCFLGITLLFQVGQVALIVLASLLATVIGICSVALFVWCRFYGGNVAFFEYLEARQEQHAAMSHLVEDMETLKLQTEALLQHTGMSNKYEKPVYSCLEAWSRQRHARRTMLETIKTLKARVASLIESTGLDLDELEDQVRQGDDGQADADQTHRQQQQSPQAESAPSPTSDDDDDDDDDEDEAYTCFEFFRPSLLFLLVCSLVCPPLIVGLVVLFRQDKVGFTALASTLTAIAGLVLLRFFCWCHFKDGDRKCQEAWTNWKRRRLALSLIVDDLDYLENKTSALVAFTSIIEEVGNDFKS